MSSKTILTDDEIGKRVVDPNGETVGRITEVEDGVAYVDPDSSLTETIMSKLGWGDDQDTEVYRLERTDVETVNEDRVGLRQ